MTLVLDIGNTALKWRVYHEGGVTQGDCLHGRAWDEVIGALRVDWGAAVDRIWVASVAGRAADAELSALLERAFALRPDFYYSVAAESGLTNAYAEAHRLGVDRWLAMLEGWHRSGPCVVVDCGSALTLDAVDASGNHRGGYIVPGLGMLRESLAAGTAEVQVPEDRVTALAPGQSTAEGVRHGILRMTVAFIRDGVLELRRSLADTCTVFLTGGDAEHIAPLLDMEAELAPDLVLDGLERVMRRQGKGG
jgi:type III pantothenate kinase